MSWPLTSAGVYMVFAISRAADLAFVAVGVCGTAAVASSSSSGIHRVGGFGGNWGSDLAATWIDCWLIGPQLIDSWSVRCSVSICIQYTVLREGSDRGYLGIGGCPASYYVVSLMESHPVKFHSDTVMHVYYHLLGSVLSQLHLEGLMISL